MTNSTPKPNNKIQRQGSPNGSSGKKPANQQQRVGLVKTAMYFPSSGGANRQQQQQQQQQPKANGTNGGGGRLSCSPQQCPAKSARNSPLRYESPRGSPTNSFYAGAKFSEPPSPASLPKPPSHWTSIMSGSCRQAQWPNDPISNHLKMVLNVQA